MLYKYTYIALHYLLKMNRCLLSGRPGLVVVSVHRKQSGQVSRCWPSRTNVWFSKVSMNGEHRLRVRDPTAVLRERVEGMPVVVLTGQVELVSYGGEVCIEINAFSVPRETRDDII